MTTDSRLQTRDTQGSPWSALQRSVSRFRKDPWFSIQKNAYFIVLNRRNPLVRQALQRSQAAAETKLRKIGCLDFLATRPSSAIPPKFDDLWFLYKTVRARKPRCILEFGSGCSTIVMAHALWHNRKESSHNVGHLYSVDSESYWTDVTRAGVPPHLEEFCDIVYGPVNEVDYRGTPAFRHTNVPNVTPDLIYLDGPQLTRERRIAVDVLDLEGRFQSGFCLIIDGRWTNMQFLRHHLRGRYKFAHRWLHSNHMAEFIAKPTEQLEDQ